MAQTDRRFGAVGRTILVILVTIACVALAPAAASAKGKGKHKAKASGAKKIAVLAPAGGNAKDAVIATKIVKALKQHKIHAVSGAPVKKAVAKNGVPSSDDDWVSLARRLKVDGVIDTEMSETGSTRRAEVVIRTGADGSVAGRETFTAKGPPAKLAGVVAGGFWKKLGSAIKDTAAPKKEEGGTGMPAHDLPPAEATASGGEKSEAAAPAAKEKEAEEPAAAKPEEKVAGAEKPAGEADKAKAEEGKAAKDEEGDEGAGAAAKPAAREGGEENKEGKEGKEGKPRAPRAVEVQVGARAMKRVFQFVPNTTKFYVLNFVPLVEWHVAWYPITYAGIFVDGEFNAALKTGTNPSFPTGDRELVVGAQGRYPLSFGLIGLSAAYFQHVFVIGDTPDQNDASRSTLPWPNTSYQGARIAASGRFYVGDRILVGVEAAYRLVTNPGENGNQVRSQTYFPAGQVSVGLDGSAFVGVGVVPWLEIRAGADYRRYVFGKLTAGNQNVAMANFTGATDDYLGFTLSLVGVYGGR